MTRSMSVTSDEGVPRLLDLVEIGHVGHRAPGVEVGEDHRLVVAGEHVGRLGHEVHAAEHDELGLVVLLGEHREAVAVATGVGPPDHLVALVVVSEDEGPRSPRAALAAAIRCGELVGGRGGVALVERCLEPQHVGCVLHGGFRFADGGDSPVASPAGMSSPELICRRIPGRHGQRSPGSRRHHAFGSRGAGRKPHRVA